MKDITIILPIHEYNKDNYDFLKKSLQSIAANRKTYKKGKLNVICVCPENITNELKPILDKELSKKYKFVINEGKTDFCSQVNLGAKNVEDKYFSVLEFDDVYKDNWFAMAEKYYYTNESVTLFLPINLFVLNFADNHVQFGNEIAWAGSFSNEIGYIDFDCLQDYTSFNLTGGIFNTADFLAVDGFDPDIKIAFNYDFLLKVTSKKLKVFVVPKEGYVHLIGRKDSLTDKYNKELSQDEIAKFFNTTQSKYNIEQETTTSEEK